MGFLYRDLTCLLIILIVLSKIAFQYYPWDLNPASNPFIVSWWPLALADPPLFHVSLQTACLDDEFHAQKGFAHSDILMRDTVSLIRHKIEDPTLAYENATLDSVVTMAAIEVCVTNFCGNCLWGES